MILLVGMNNVDMVSSIWRLVHKMRKKLLVHRLPSSIVLELLMRRSFIFDVVDTSIPRSSESFKCG
jgi:hypothetical protein